MTNSVYQQLLSVLIF